MNLLNVPIGAWARLTSVNARLQAKLRQYGLHVGDRVRVLRSAPLGGPLLVEVNGREIALGARGCGKNFCRGRMRVALIGPPNCGKSTLFNQVAGYKAETGNFSGTTVTFTESRVRVAGEVIELVDLPGTYTLEGGSPAEEQAARYLESRDVHVIINVADATQLAAGLELSLDLLPLRKPLVLALNMMDEAARTGLHIDGQGLSQALGIPVLPLIASKGRGVKQLFVKTLELGSGGQKNGHVLSDAEARHKLAGDLVQKYVTQGERRYTWRDRIDDVLLHPVWGYVILLFVLFLFFQAVYGIGKLTEPPLLALFELLTRGVLTPFGAETLLSEIVLGIMQGVAAGVAIVLPYLLPFLFGLGFLEDIGYLPRIAFPHGCLDAPYWSAWQSHCAVHPRVWMQRACGHVHAHARGAA
jgi:ferrous iron transport protein B